MPNPNLSGSINIGGRNKAFTPMGNSEFSVSELLPGVHLIQVMVTGDGLIGCGDGPRGLRIEEDDTLVITYTVDAG